MFDARNDPPPGVDPTKSSVARLYDCLLGGKDHYAVDRQVARELAAVVPEIAQAAMENRQFVSRVCRFLAQEEGVTQFLDCGSGLPTTENVHQIAQRANPAAKVIYVDYDPVVASHGRALLDHNEYTEIVEADFFDPASVLDDPTVLGHLDWSRPIAVLFFAALHHHSGDRGLPAKVTRAFVDRLAPGSFLAVSFVLDAADESPEDHAVKKLLDAIHKGPMKDVASLTREEIAELFHETELLPPRPGTPGEVVTINDWWPDGPGLSPPTVARRILAGGVARKR